MSRNATCHDCGTEQSASQLRLNGCWYCDMRAQEQSADSRFAEFMLNDEETRWRLIWDATLGEK
jgi:hypothetical protein